MDQVRNEGPYFSYFYDEDNFILHKVFQNDEEEFLSEEIGDLSKQNPILDRNSDLEKTLSYENQGTRKTIILNTIYSN